MDDRDVDGEDTASEALAEDAQGSVAASALRWLRGSRAQEGVDRQAGGDAEERSGAGVDPWPSDGSDEDDLELTRALGADDADDGAEREGRERQPEAKAAAKPALPPAPVHRADLIYFDYDDDDDIDDFDDLGDLDDILHRPPVAPVPVFAPDPAFAGIDPEEIPSADDRDEALPLAPEPVEPAAVPEAAVDVFALAVPAFAAVAGPTAAMDEEAAAAAPLIPEHGAKVSLARPARRLDEAAIPPLDATLSLQPIPELQPDFCPLVTRSGRLARDDGDRPAELQLDDHPPLPDPRDAAPDDDLVPDAAPFEDDADDLVPDALHPASDNDGTLELDTPWAAEEIHAGSDDWHAQLADALAGADEDDRPVPALPALPPSTGRETDIAAPPVIRTLARHEAGADQPEEEEGDVFLPPVLVERPRRRFATAQAPLAPPPDDGPLTGEQLALAIVAHVPRLRRFAAVQIGDELQADRLVQLAVKTALADLAPLASAPDLGLALLALLYRERQRMLAAGTLGRLPEEARAFQAALCQGLAGADQFEIHQLAGTMNGLDEGDRELLTLAALESLTYRQIAEVTGFPAEEIMARLAQARLRLRQALDDDDAVAAGPASDPHPRELEIHGYLDGELDGHHMAEIDSLVEGDQGAADRLLHYGIQGDLIRRLYAPLLNRPLPGALLEALSAAMKASAAARSARRSRPFRPRRALLAGALMLTLGGSAVLAYLSLLPEGLVADAMTAPLLTIMR